MVFSSKISNPIRNLMELHCSTLEVDDGSAVDVKVQVLIQPDEIDVDKYTVEFEMRRAYLCVETHGCAAEADTKYGLRKKPEWEDQTETVELQTTTHMSETAAAEAVLGATLGPKSLTITGSAKLAASASNAQEVKAGKRREQTSRHINAEAITADRWLLSNEGMSPLSGAYIGARLCRLVKSPQPSNRYGATITAEVKKADIDINVKEDRNRLSFSSPNKDKILKLLIATHLSGERQPSATGFIRFSSAEVQDDG